MGLPIGAYGALAFTYITLKLVTSLRYEPSHGTATPSVSVIIPEYNEDPDLLERGLRNLLEQTYPIEEVWLVDDGSEDIRAWAIAKRLATEFDKLHVHRLPENRGKRHAQAYAFRRASGDIFVTMDSDTIPRPNSVEELLRPFASSDVQAATAHPRIVNRDANWLTKLIDMRYWVAFHVERAAQSVAGTVTCCCGVLSAYRADLVRDVVDDYTAQTFLGRECTFGDDRRLTAYALQRGRVEFQSTAKADTAAPETFGGYLRQQARWMRSFWRESVLALRWAPRRSLTLTGMLIADLALPLALLMFGGGALIWRASEVHPSVLAAYPIVVAAVAFLRNAPYAREDLSIYAMSPVYGVLYLLVLLPLSFYALATVRRNGWGTR